jgi:hypothetical protein
MVVAAAAAKAKRSPRCLLGVRTRCWELLCADDQHTDLSTIPIQSPPRVVTATACTAVTVVGAELSLTDTVVTTQGLGAEFT